MTPRERLAAAEAPFADPGFWDRPADETDPILREHIDAIQAVMEDEGLSELSEL